MRDVDDAWRKGDLDRKLELYPHYTETIPSGGRTVFGATREGLFYNYSDRLLFGPEGRRAEFIANELGEPGTGRWITHFLSAFHERPVELVHVVVGVNRSNGYRWQAFGYVIGGDA